MTNPVELNIYGIKCDSCDFNDMAVQVNDYPEWVNKPCPKCNANLLTEADYKNVKLLIKLAEITNIILPKNSSDEEKVTMTVEMNGTGEMDFDIKG
ncbi:hypothetical protein ACQKM1_22390 [Peribacillus frigoritolerans]|uniref:hypothetical protein n=1 Tax=Peribacillus frigoritolerans TaxID=450367 RepID=UPI003D046559